MKEVQPFDLPKPLQYLALAKSYPIVQDEDGTYRFKPNGVIGFLRSMKAFDLNHIWRAMECKMFSMEDLMDFYCSLGYSLTGFDELFGEYLQEEKEQQCHT